MPQSRSAQAYLDIETTGLSPRYSEITVIGAYLVQGNSRKLTQLVGPEITQENLLSILQYVHTIHTYNGSGFDLPFIRQCLNLDLTKLYCHHDLMHDCWRCNLYGGLKAVETKLGINRRLKNINGVLAVRLWYDYINNNDRMALDMLLYYNREDVMNLREIERRLKFHVVNPDFLSTG